MSAMTFGQKSFTPTPPDKGSFPLDHEGECKTFMLRYMLCLRENNYENQKCREKSKEYLECRMEKGLMAKEEWSKLGFKDSLYAYRGTHSRTLAFNAKEKFLEIGSSKDPNWVHVINENGKLGYVPKNYMTLEQVSSVEMLELIDACIEGIHLSASEKSGSYSKFEQEALQILVEKRQEWYNKIPPTMHPSKRPAPPPPCRTSSQLSVDSIGSNFSDGSLPSPCQPPPSSISTPIQATTSNLKD
ncbi:cytochrome c oxidase assembly protein COX19 [Armadillidium vulgare]|nr:cytochrome c oxidase assembly protein COX19 [Armadillidium vulgare]